MLVDWHFVFIFLLILPFIGWSRPVRRPQWKCRMIVFSLCNHQGKQWIRHLEDLMRLEKGTATSRAQGIDLQMDRGIKRFDHLKSLSGRLNLGGCTIWTLQAVNQKRLCGITAVMLGAWRRFDREKQHYRFSFSTHSALYSTDSSLLHPNVFILNELFHFP